VFFKELYVELIDYNVKPGCKFTSYPLDRVDKFVDNQVANLNDQVNMQNMSGFEYPVVDWQDWRLQFSFIFLRCKST